MPRPPDQSARELWRGAGDAWTMVTELLTATGVWAAIGYGLDRLFDTWPVLFALGAVLGHATGIYMVYRRSMTGVGHGGPGTMTKDPTEEAK